MTEELERDRLTETDKKVLYTLESDCVCACYTL